MLESNFCKACCETTKPKAGKRRIPKVGDEMYMDDRRVKVVEVYDYLHLAEFSFIGENKICFTDMYSLSDEPDLRLSIPIGGLSIKLG